MKKVPANFSAETTIILVLFQIGNFSTKLTKMSPKKLQAQIIIASL
jgi:hypothetical protein